MSDSFSRAHIAVKCPFNLLSDGGAAVPLMLLCYILPFRKHIFPQEKLFVSTLISLH